MATPQEDFFRLLMGGQAPAGAPPTGPVPGVQPSANPLMQMPVPGATPPSMAMTNPQQMQTLLQQALQPRESFAAAPQDRQDAMFQLGLGLLGQQGGESFGEALARGGSAALGTLQQGRASQQANALQRAQTAIAGATAGQSLEAGERAAAKEAVMGPLEVQKARKTLEELDQKMAAAQTTEEKNRLEMKATQFQQGLAEKYGEAQVRSNLRKTEAEAQKDVAQAGYFGRRGDETTGALTQKQQIDLGDRIKLAPELTKALTEKAVAFGGRQNLPYQDLKALIENEMLVNQYHKQPTTGVGGTSEVTAPLAAEGTTKGRSSALTVPPPPTGNSYFDEKTGQWISFK